MLLSKPQKRILELICAFGGLKESILFALCGNPPGFDTMLHQLQMLGRIVKLADYICLDDRKICDRETESALEIMLRIAESPPDYFHKGAFPFTLTFFKLREEKLYRYDICMVPDGKEMVVSAFLEGINTKYRIICLLVEDLSKRDMLDFPCEYIFVTKENGEYHYYK